MVWSGMRHGVRATACAHMHCCEIKVRGVMENGRTGWREFNGAACIRVGCIKVGKAGAKCLLLVRCHSTVCVWHTHLGSWSGCSVSEVSTKIG